MFFFLFFFIDSCLVCCINVSGLSHYVSFPYSTITPTTIMFIHPAYKRCCSLEHKFQYHFNLFLRSNTKYLAWFPAEIKSDIQFYFLCHWDVKIFNVFIRIFNQSNPSWKWISNQQSSSQSLVHWLYHHCATASLLSPPNPIS